MRSAWRAHQHHPAGGARIDAVAVVVGHDQAGGGGAHRLLDKAVERPAQLHQARPLVLEHLPDRPVLELRVPGALGVGDALIFQPGVQLGQALHPRLGAEQLVAQIADLVLDLPLLPARRRRARHRLDQMVRAHLQKAAIILARLANEDRLHRRLHVVVNAAPANPADRRRTPCRGRRTPVPGSRGSRPARTASGCATASCAPP